MKKATVLEVLKSFDEDVDLEKLITMLLIIEEGAFKCYNPEFVNMIRKGDEDLKSGKGAKVDIDNLWK